MPKPNTASSSRQRMLKATLEMAGTTGLVAVPSQMEVKAIIFRRDSTSLWVGVIEAVEKKVAAVAA